MESLATRAVPSQARKRKFHEASPAKPTRAPIDPKRRKRQDAREISAQTAESAFRDGQFDPVSFVNSREYEIRSLLRSMNSSKNAQRKRAFQSLPRELRRRTAAHNPNRAPKRVRETARKELTEDNTTVRKKRRDYCPSARRLNANQLRILSLRNNNSMIPKAVPGSRQTATRGLGRTRSYIGSKSSRYRKRQRHKTWLPTHIWCAKRARMVLKWGFSLVETPNLKCYRPTYRAATRDACIAVDTSYYATILLVGQERDLKKSLAKFLPPLDLAVVGRSVVSGESVRSTWMYEEGEWPNKPLAPIQIFWCPINSVHEMKEQELRNVVLRVHPASWDDAWKVAAASAAASACVCKNLRFEVGSIELIGPRTADILRALLNPNLDLDGILVDGVKHSSARDPRLSSFHLRTTIPCPPSQENTTNHAESLFSANCRTASVKAQVSQKTLNSRISKSVSGEAAKAAAAARIPFVLMREILGVLGTQPSSSRPHSETPLSHRWSILLPWKWVRPFWLVLMRMPGVRLGGLKELEQLTLESGVGYFPTDFPSTSAGRVEALERTQAQLNRLERRSTMKTKPSSKKSESTTLSKGGYPWGEVLDAGRHFTCEEPGFWQLTPDSVRLFRKSLRSMLPTSISSGIFTAHIRLYGRGNIDSNAFVYTFSGEAARLVPRMLLQHARDGNPIDNVLETLDGENGQLNGIGHNSPPAYSLAGFVIRGNFGFRQARPVAIAALAWARTHESEPSVHQEDCFGGWCILQNKGSGIRRLAQWNAV
ncbi:hypothetical protein TWF225_003149 [Orbilia oligospora]|nr:hypothetical protein TWF225_003149 [Orbilia oligospora]KAF3234276.1 hypothetical protein TWF128_002558 [Orbilia oligospora]KAF3236956.1 hypothetical protein TWF217_002413 [Orbilia oligospora]